MKDFQDYYAILHVSRHATQEQIKKRHRNLCMALHPDRTDGETQGEEELKEINCAYSILNNPDAREKYNVEWDYRQRHKTDTGHRNPPTSKPEPEPEPESPPKEEPKPPPKEEPRTEPEPTPPPKAEPSDREPLGYSRRTVYVETEKAPDVPIGFFKSVAITLKPINDWVNRGKIKPMEEPIACTIRWFFYSLVQIPQVIFCLPILIVASSLNDGGRFGGAYIISTFMAAPIARFISTFVDNIRKRKIVFTLAFYPIVLLIMFLIFYDPFI